MNLLMTLEEIAEMHHCNVRRARDIVVRKQGFPPEAPTSCRSQRLWVRREVESFVLREPAQTTHSATVCQ